MKRFLPKLLTLLTPVLFALLFVPTAAAQSLTADAVGLMAIPPRIGEDGGVLVKPGGTIQLEVRVRNTSGKAVTVQSLAEDFIIGDDGKTPVPVSEMTSSRWSMAQWIQIPKNLNQIPSGESVEIPFVVQVPTDALPGGRYAMVMHEIAGASASQLAGQTGGQTGISQRVGSLVYLKVEGSVTEDANIRNLTIPSLVEYGPVPISFELENLSDVHIRPVATVTVRDWFGREVDSMAVETQNVFPFTQRKFETSWEHVWGIGKYSVTVESSYGSTGKVATAKGSFWMIPYTMIALTILLILAGVAVILAIRRHLHHRNDVTRSHIELLEEKIKHLESELPERP